MKLSVNVQFNRPRHDQVVDLFLNINKRVDYVQERCHKIEWP